MYIIYVFMRALLYTLTLCTGQIFPPFGNSMRPLSKGEKKKPKKEKRSPGRTGACLADVYILYLWESARWRIILWNHTGERDLKNQILCCARGKKHEQTDLCISTLAVQNSVPERLFCLELFLCTFYNKLSFYFCHQWSFCFYILQSVMSCHLSLCLSPCTRQ